ncbi:hypothetical protein NUU61_008142 [Penicillium alfredii]|uniref:Uncharacterized protein n=1 Tax=Penicillium alfredii TaxID=1506179 RepID=A0A9W9JZ44_9EURO|nr:uncharacterized protein NUU61_008142 [Penicillium alfredii]KAJ5086835.1 hypothetical protein NUU61_008142 [Penicillium alfredii]
MHEKPNREDEDPVDRILQGLSMDEYDEPTELALLTLSVELVYAVHYWSGSRGGDLAIVATRCLQYASTHAALIQEHSPWLVKTRPYLQWVLAKERFDRIWNTAGSVKEQERPRSTHTTGTTLYKWSLPRYIPKETENPGWPSPDAKFPPNQTLQGVLEAARELGDYKTEAACLTELICRVEDPRELLGQLGHLQQAIQGDRFGYLNTCISRYLLAKDEASIRTLIADLEQTASQLCTTPEDDACPAIRFDELRVKSALYRSLPGHSPEADRYKNLADTLSIDLPAPFRPLDTRSDFLDYDDDDDWTRPEFTETEPRVVITEPGRRRTSYRARDTDALPNTNTPKVNLVRSGAQGARFRERERSVHEDPDEERFERIPKEKQEVRGRTSRDDEAKPKTKSSEEVGKDVVADRYLNPIIQEVTQEDTEKSRPQNSGKKNLTSVEVDEDSSEDEDVGARDSE